MVMFWTITGVELFVRVPLPNCPDALLPQHFTVPFVSRAQAWSAPAEIMLLPPGIGVGVTVGVTVGVGVGVCVGVGVGLTGTAETTLELGLSPPTFTALTA